MSKANFTPAIDCTNEQRPAIALKPVERAGELHTEDPDHGDEEQNAATAADLEAAGQTRLIA